ncbi:MAG: metallophosphoesterase [Prevotella sp.]|nr:metallophosphoesterase [Prevotella sp.]
MTSLLFILLQPDTYIYIGWGCLALLSLLVVVVCRRIRRRRWKRWLLALPLLLLWGVFLWGTYVGFGQLEVVHLEFASRDLPEAFDGYRIVHFGDAHVGSYTGSREAILQRAVDSINAQNADLVVFTGDLQNKEPDEILAAKPILSRIKAPDGVVSILGNHDYTMYTGLTDAIAIGTNQGNTEGYQTDMGWRLLMNSRFRIRRDSASIVIAGLENDGEGRFPQLGNISSALYGVSRNEFVVMLEHDPTAWRRKILPHCHAQLTLSGHTHGGQFSLFGLSPAMFMYKEYQGMYYAGDRALYVTKGLGGVIPFRFGVKPEIAVITLRRITN